MPERTIAGRPLRVLALGPQDAFPPVDGGKEGIFGLLSALASRCELSYAYPSALPNTSRRGYEQAGIRPLPVAWAPSESVPFILAATARLLPYKFEKYATGRAQAAFSAAIPRQEFDALLCLHAHTFALGKRLSVARGWQIPTLVREHNIEYEIVASFRRTLPWHTRMVVMPFELLTLREERRIWRQADAVAFLSDHDLECAQASRVDGRFVLAREGVPLPSSRQAAHPGRGAPLLILLNPRATQSVANLRDFLRRDWRAAHNDRRLQGLGLQVTGVTTEQLAEHVGLTAETLKAMRVTGLGFIDSLSGVLSSSLALVSPSYVGGGIRKKILEAMAHELPVIATDLDLSSCSYFRPQENVLRMSSVEQFCESVDRLRTDPACWQAFSRSGRSTVERFASWPACAEVIVDTFEALLDRARGARGTP